MRRLAILALALSGAALAQVPTPTPPMCPSTAGLEVGMPRAAAFDMMRLKSPELKTTNAKAVHHAPAGRPYQVDVTFASEQPDAKVVKLDYLFKPSGVFDALRERWGEPAERPAPGTYLWRIERCKVTLVYRAHQDDRNRLAGEEMVVEPLAAPAKGAKK